jgi:hypothetical protein
VLLEGIGLGKRFNLETSGELINWTNQMTARLVRVARMLPLKARRMFE